jgi:hypothetical protein
MSYIAGDFWRICDRSGFRVRASDTAREWNGLIVRKGDFEERHPQDFVRGRKDRQTVPDPRPEPTVTMIGPLETTTTAAASPGATTVSVASSARWGAGDHIGIMLEVGSVHRAVVQSVPDATSLELTVGLPGAAASGAIITNYSAVSTADVG